MRHKTLLCLMLGAATMVSCIQDAPLNAEADIVAVTFDRDNRDVLLNTNDTIVTVGTDAASANINITISPTGDITAVAPTFILTEGATITHLASGMDGNGLALDFTNPQTYRVTSQDGKWHKDYTLAFTPPVSFTKFDFEHFEMISGGRYVNYYEIGPDNRRYDIWATANAGYAMCGLSTFPTQRYDYGQSGNGVRLSTETTGGFGAMMNPPMPIAAGNLFFGRFDALNAISSPRTATLFGMPFDKMPTAFTGYYMFKRGDTMTDDSGAVIEGEKDHPDFYIVMYENYDIIDGKRHSIMLDGNNVLTHENIVGLARINSDDIVPMTDEKIARGEWQYFNIPFELKEGKQIDRERLANYGYNVAIVLSSSVNGAYFRGAVGSTLYIDTLEIICED